MASDVAEVSESYMEPLQLSVPLPFAPSVKINLHLTIQSPSMLLFMTTVANEAQSTSCPLGSFVYAMPNRNASQPPLTTALYTHNQTLDLATRMASVLAKKTGKPTYVGNSMTFVDAAGGGNADEEIAGFRKVVEVVMAEVENSTGGKLVNGT